MPTIARAIVMRRTGGPEVLAVEEVSLAPLAPGEARLRALASAVNHSDLEVRAGNWPIRREPRFPYVPGLEVVGEVVEVADDVRAFAVGDRAWTTMQGLGGVRAERDGGYAEYVTVAADALAASRGDLPESQLAIATTADEHGAIGGKRGIDEEARAAAIGLTERPCSGVPEPDRPIATSRDDLVSPE